MKFKRIKLSQASSKKLQTFKSKTGLTPNIACRLALSLSLSQSTIPSVDLFTEEDGQEINRYTLLGEHETLLMSLFLQWCNDNSIESEKRYKYFIAHINYGIEMLVNRVKGLADFATLVKCPNLEKR